MHNDLHNTIYQTIMFGSQYTNHIDFIWIFFLQAKIKCIFTCYRQTLKEHDSLDLG